MIPLCGAASSTPPSWWITIGAALLGALGARAAVRLWRGDSVYSRNRREAEDQLGFVTLTMIPTSAALLALAFGNAALIIRTKTAHDLAGNVLLVFAAAMGVVFVVGFALAASLFFVMKPRKLIPPHLRNATFRGGK
jgi:hypothetical protein